MHHFDKVLVSWAAEMHISVVSEELTFGHMSFCSLCKTVKKLLNDVISWSRSWQKVLIWWNVKRIFQVFNRNCSRASVELVKSPVHNVFQSLGQRFSKSCNEFFIWDMTVAVRIVIFHKDLKLNNWREQSDVIFLTRKLLKLARIPSSQVSCLRWNQIDGRFTKGF